MGKNLDLLHCLLGSCQFFESPLNIHKMSQVICHHSWVSVGLGRTFLDHCQFGPPPIGYSSSHMESSWMPPAFRTYCVNAA
jgi:hypothetical protein